MPLGSVVEICMNRCAFFVHIVFFFFLRSRPWKCFGVSFFANWIRSNLVGGAPGVGKTQLAYDCSRFLSFPSPNISPFFFSAIFNSSLFLERVCWMFLIWCCTGCKLHWIHVSHLFLEEWREKRSILVSCQTIAWLEFVFFVVVVCFRFHSSFVS